MTSYSELTPSWLKKGPSECQEDILRREIDKLKREVQTYKQEARGASMAAEAKDKMIDRLLNKMMEGIKN